MARFNEILVGRFNRALQKRLGLKGGPPAPQLTSDIAATIDADTIRQDYSFIHQVNYFGARVSVNGVAAVNTVVRLRNPAGSNVVGVLVGINIIESVADTGGVIQMGATVDLAGPIAGAGLDNRLGNQSSTLITSGSTNVAAAPRSVYSYGVLANSSGLELMTHEGLWIPILPADSVDVRTAAVNVQLIVGFRWFERALEEGEIK